jgi:hypothetical protein
MDTDPPAPDDVSRFAELHDESLKLLDAARLLVLEMRTSLDECRRRRPVLDIARLEGDRSSYPALKSRLGKSHRGGRVSRKRGRRLRRPR